MALPKPKSTSVLEFIVRATIDGQATQNVLHFVPSLAAPAPETAFTLQDGVEAVREFWRTNILPLVNQAYKVEDYIGRELSGTGPNPASDPKTPNVVTVRQFWQTIGGDMDVGGVGEPIIPTFDAIGVKRSTNMNGRNSTSVLRFGGLSVPDILVADGNKLSAAAVVAWTGIKDLLSTVNVDPGIGGDTMAWCLFLRTAALAAPGPLASLTAYAELFNSATVSPFITSQVSRKQRISRGA